MIVYLSKSKIANETIAIKARYYLHSEGHVITEYSGGVYDQSEIDKLRNADSVLMVVADFKNEDPTTAIIGRGQYDQILLRKPKDPTLDNIIVTYDAENFYSIKSMTPIHNPENWNKYGIITLVPKTNKEYNNLLLL